MLPIEKFSNEDNGSQYQCIFNLVFIALIFCKVIPFFIMLFAVFAFFQIISILDVISVKFFSLFNL
jgi:hypothetical protein